MLTLLRPPLALGLFKTLVGQLVFFGFPTPLGLDRFSQAFMFASCEFSNAAIGILLQRGE